MTAINQVSFENSVVSRYKNTYPHLFFLEYRGVPCLFDDYDKRLYAKVSEVSRIGFTATVRFFGNGIRIRIKFSDCTLINDPNTVVEASTAEKGKSLKPEKSIKTGVKGRFLMG